MANNDILKQTQIVIPAGGSGQRFGENKLLYKINGTEVFIHTLKPFVKLFDDENIFIVVPESDLLNFEAITKKHFTENRINFVIGGNSRAQSVANGLDAGKNGKNFDYIMIHDAARPLITTKVINESLDELVNSQKEFAGVVVAKKIVDTIKKVDENGCFIKTIDRSNLWAMETPQVFILEKFKKAYKKVLAENVNLESFTDDAAIMAENNFKVEPFDNETINCKITYRHDLEMAEFLLGKYYGD